MSRAGFDFTFYHVAKNGSSELLLGPLIEVLSVDDAHLLEESGLATLARSEQQNLHQALHIRFVSVETLVYFLRFSYLFRFATREETVRKT